MRAIDLSLQRAATLAMLLLLFHSWVNSTAVGGPVDDIRVLLRADVASAEIKVKPKIKSRPPSLRELGRELINGAQEVRFATKCGHSGSSL